ncbi:DUF1016 N-terminal domain-containing protein [Pollutimonas subterranea]|uniref:DUF1016 N-terminal domain-containing protein n=1 Tax=Pollutimonas subterranea TaxID=2045210 RepID=UPI001E5A1105|nr:DUF1016 N-terminal domain-containing protein [Pollutimonas subterranea]
MHCIVCVRHQAARPPCPHAGHAVGQRGKGFSERNIKRMLAFYREYPHLDVSTGSAGNVPQAVAQIATKEKGPQAVAQRQQEPAAPPDAASAFPPELLRSLPWGHYAELIAKVKDPATRRWYMRAAIENGWSRNIVLVQIEIAAHRRQGQAANK